LQEAPGNDIFRFRFCQGKRVRPHVPRVPSSVSPAEPGFDGACNLTESRSFGHGAWFTIRKGAAAFRVFDLSFWHVGAAAMAAFASRALCYVELEL